MKANELRLGNLIRFISNIEPAKNVVVNARFFSSLAGGKPLDELKPDEEISGYYQPIPLSPDVLEKCGFDYMDNYTCLKGEWCFKRTAGGIGLLFHYEHHCNPKGRQVAISFLHHLQNFLFIHTGEELEVSM